MEVTYQNVPVGAALVVKSDNSKQPENRTVVDKTGPTANNMYCLVMDDNSRHYGLGDKPLKLQQ
jgi:hypothetical protein